jgi:two-component system response regulator PilR (NtrC family)
VEAFINKFAEQQQSKVKGITDGALRTLLAWSWPGNVRELENVIERGVILASGDRIDIEALPANVRGAPTMPPQATAVLDDIPTEGLDLEATLESYERRLLEKALARTGGRKKKAAELLRLSFRSFRYRLAKLGVSGGDDDAVDEA